MKKALIVIDVQNYFVNEYTKSLPAKIAHFIQNNTFDLVLFRKFVNHKNSNFVRLLNWRECLNPPDTDIHPAIASFVLKDNIFKSTSFSVFKSLSLIDVLKKSRIDQISLCGIDTDACILASAFDAFDLGYEVHILKELSFSSAGEKLNNAAMQIINRNLEQQ